MRVLLVLSFRGVMVPREHNARIMLDERDGMTVQIPKHGIAAPVAQDADFVRINPVKEEGHCTAGME